MDEEQKKYYGIWDRNVSRAKGAYVFQYWYIRRWHQLLPSMYQGVGLGK